MEVETGLSSLLDKLKVEDPFLPPQSWESLPSESGRPTSRVPASSDCSYASSVSEQSIVRLALNALLGLESAIVSIEKLSSAFCAESADRTFHNIPSLWNRMSSTVALGRILRSIGCFGSLVFLLQKFVDHFTKLSLSEKTTRKKEENSGLKQSENISNCNVEGESCSYSLVNQAFAIAVRKVLEGYICVLDTLCATVKFRRSPNNIDRPMNDSLRYGCLANVVQSDLTLLEVYLHTRELRTQIEALGNICNLHDVAASYVDSSLGDLTIKANLLYQNFYRGGDLLTYLYTQLKVADPAHRSLLKFLFLRSCEPYCGFIRSWIFKAQISDPYEEFIVECAEDFTSHLQSKPGDSPMARVMEREGAVVPCFLKSFLVPLVRAGQQLQVVMKLLQLCTSASETDSYADLLPCWTGYTGPGPFVASLMTFSKMHIERMAQERDFYYEKMQYKLMDISGKLELSSDQVSKVRSLISSTSITLEDSMSVPSTAEENSAAAERDLDSDDLNKENGWSSEVDESASSECSSTEDSEETTEGRQLKLTNKFVGPVQSHLSALSFSMITLADNSFQKQLQLDKSCHVEINSHCKSMRTDGHDLFIKSQLGELSRPDKSFHCKGAREDDHDLIVKSQLAESDRISKDVYNYENLSVKLWPLGGLSRNPFCVDGDSVDEVRLCPSDSGHRRRKKGVVLFNDYAPLFNRTPNSDSGTTETTDGSQLGYMSFLGKKKVNQPGNLLSINPMLMKSVFFTPTSKLAEGNIKDSGKLLPWFDFSLVDDPCKAFSGKLSAGFTDDLPEKPTDAVTTCNSGSQSKKEYCASNILVEESRSYNRLPWGSMNHNEEDPPNASGGGRWESLLGRLNMLDNGEASGCTEDSFDACELPLDVVIDKCLLQEILLQYNYVSKLTIRVLEEGFSLKEHLLALRRYHFMELADWADLFIKSLWRHKWLVPETDQRITEIQRCLELSIQRSSCEQDFYKDRLFMYVKGQDTMPHSSSAIGVHSFDFVGLGYRVNWPVSIILTSDALKAYADIFSFLIRMKLAAFSLTDMWCSMKDVMHSINQHRHDVSEQELRRLKVLLKLRHQVNHFVSMLQQYVQSELAHVSWSKFLHSLKHKGKDMMDLESLHMAYLNESLHICFLSDETRAISRIIDNILQSALDFRSCLHRGTRNSEPYQGDIRTTSFGVNTTQVVAVKQEFEKHMKELQMWYMRSPNKHGELGLSRFWGYLNFNEYYSNLLNDATGSAFLF